MKVVWSISCFTWDRHCFLPWYTVFVYFGQSKMCSPNKRNPHLLLHLVTLSWINASSLFFASRARASYVPPRESDCSSAVSLRLCSMRLSCATLSTSSAVAVSIQTAMTVLVASPPLPWSQSSRPCCLGLSQTTGPYSPLKELAKSMSVFLHICSPIN